MPRPGDGLSTTEKKYDHIFLFSLMESVTRSRQGAEFARPRRPNLDTIAYLKSLPLVDDVARNEIAAFCDRQQWNADGSQSQTSQGSTEFPASLAAALTALEEIGQEVASLAGDERGAEMLEVLVKITAPCSMTAAYKWLSACRGYAHHLALHRYGSHVLQTILEQCFLSSNPTSHKSDGMELDLALHSESPVSQSDPSDNDNERRVTKDDLWEILQDLQEELLPAVGQLNTHMCATHVLRTLFFILAGIECHSLQAPKPRRGKPKSKKHGKFSALGNESGSSAIGSTIQYLNPMHRRPSNNEKAIKSLDNWADTFAPSTNGGRPGELQELACDPSGGPLLMALLKSLTYRDKRNTVILPSAKEIDSSFRSLGKLPDEPKFEKNSKACMLTTRILCLQDEEEQHANTQAENAVYGLAGDPRGSHVLDTIFRLCHDEMHTDIVDLGKFVCSIQEYVEHDVSNFVVQTILATVRSPDVAQRFIDACVPLIESGLIVDAANRRRGILWRLSEMAVKLNVGQAVILQSLHLQFHRKKLAGLLLDPKRNSENDNRLLLNVEGSRSLMYLLQFDCPGADEVIHGVVDMSVDDLMSLARDGLGSRCVWDALLKGDHDGNDKDANKTAPLKKVRNKLLTKLKGRWTSLAIDRVGHHVVRKLFLALPTMKAREDLVRELAQGRDRLRGNAMGRCVQSECEVDLYWNQGVDEWKAKIQRKLEQKEWLMELSSSAIHPQNAYPNAMQEGAKTSCKNAKSATKRPTATLTVDYIFDAFTLPKKERKKRRKSG